MNYEDYAKYDAVGLAKLVAQKDVSPTEILDAALARMAAVNPAVNAVVRVLEDDARKAIKNGLPAGPLAGVPFLIKDIAATMQGVPTSAGSRLFVHERVFEKRMTGLSDEAAKLKIGPGLDPTTRIGPLVSEEQFQRVTGYLASGKDEGAEAITGGKRHGNEGYFIQPTVLTKTTPQMKVVREEIFGPVVCAMPFNDDDLERIARQGNATEYGLAASIWTRDIGVAHKLARKLKAGSVWINVHNFNDVALPFGGYKQSGWGREMGFEAIELYTEVKAVAALL